MFGKQLISFLALILNWIKHYVFLFREGVILQEDVNAWSMEEQNVTQCATIAINTKQKLI